MFEILCIESKAGVWWQSPQPLEAIEGWGAKPPTLRKFYSFFPKNTQFLGIIRSKSRVFRWLNKVLMRPQGFRPEARAPDFPFPLLRYWAQKQRQYICYPYSLL